VSHSTGRPRHTGFKIRPQGFTLIEIVGVIAIVAAVTLLLVATLNAGLPGQQLRNSARELAAQLRYARAQAMASGEPQVVTLDAATREWQAPQARRGQLPAAIEVIAVGVREASAAPTVATYRFFPDGASTGGHVRLRRGDAEWRVDVEWLTGEVVLRRGGGDAP
jgi:general secretion pathway protein H